MPKKTAANQLPLDFNAYDDRLVLIPAFSEHNDEAKTIFHEFIQGRLDTGADHGDTFIFNAASIAEHLNAKLRYPEEMSIVRLHETSGNFPGFSAMYRQTGWIFLNAEAELNRDHYYSYLLVVSLGLGSMYKNMDLLGKRAEKLVFEKLLPEKDVKSFFYERINHIPPTLAANISDYFKVPFALVLKRALQLQIISEEQYKMFLPVVYQVKNVKASTESYISTDDFTKDFQAEYPEK